MPLSDVWLDISSYIKVYTSVNFDEVPSSPGVYAWYYPIKLPSKNIEDLGFELSSILNYDSKLKSEKNSKANIEFNWKDIEVRVSEDHKYKFPPGVKKHWEKLIIDEKSLYSLEQVMLLASILMPPLYIGKTNNLNVRCRQHRISINTDENNFHNRFEEFTKNKILKNGKKFLHQNIEDLIFVCIKTDTFENLGKSDTNFEEILEEIFKLLANPPFGKK